MSNPPIKKVRARTIYHNRWLALEQHDVEVRASGHRFSYSFLAMAPSVMVVAVTRERKVVLVRQYRYPSVEYSFELPGGGSRGLELPDAARQELREEPVTLPRGCGSWGILSSIPACRTKSVTSSSPAAGDDPPRGVPRRHGPGGLASCRPQFGEQAGCCAARGERRVIPAHNPSPRGKKAV